MVVELIDRPEPPPVGAGEAATAPVVRHWLMRSSMPSACGSARFRWRRSASRRRSRTP